MFNVHDLLNKFITEELGSALKKDGFTLKGKSVFKRKIGESNQEVKILFRKLSGLEVGYIQIYIAIKFDTLEKLTSELKGEKPRKDWPTVSINIGNLKVNREFIEWRLDENTIVDSLTFEVISMIQEYANPFWQRFSSIQSLIEGYKIQEPSLILNGNGYKWRLSAAYWYNGQIDNAIKVLEDWNEGEPSDDLIKKAIDRLKGL